jgi:sigma-B regulation protein RsbU (phosphoserine phosphatase)
MTETAATGSGTEAVRTEPVPAVRATRPRLPSLRVLITLIVVIPIAVVSIALVFIATMTSRSIAEQLGQGIVDGATAQVNSDVSSYLGSAIRVSDLYQLRLRDGLLPNALARTDAALPQDRDPRAEQALRPWEAVMAHDLATNRDIASICFANLEYDCTYLLRHHNRLELGMVDGKERDKAIEWEVLSSGIVKRDTPLRVYLYDVAVRPWYSIGLETPYPVWVPIYNWFQNEFGAAVTGTGYVRKVMSKEGRLLGVLIIDVTLAALSDHLRDMDISHNGHVYIVDEQGLLVAASDAAVNSKGGQRLSPADSESAAARAIAPHVAPSIHGPDVHAREVENVRVFIDGQPARVQIKEIKPYPGIHWHIVTVLPESWFLAKATSLQQRAVLLAIAAIMGGLGLGLVLSRKLADPLMRLTDHVARVGGGDFDSRLHLNEASELRELSDEVNRMAAGLEQRVRLEQSIAVAEQIQQSLLPDSIPQPPGLEIAAMSRFCESTGGDYYDFVEVPNLGGHGMLVAMGDVTGHGLGAALLMATARGTMRAACIGAPSISYILSRMNDVLAGSARHGMFMTMALVFINPQTRVIRWGSAGHDPVLVYHPDSDSFDELVGGDIPLGIDPDEGYREFSRSCATPGSLVLIGTDGIWEARSPDSEMFGKPRLRQVMRENHESAQQLSRAIIQTLETWTQGTPLQDDVTFVVIKVNAAN